VSTFHCQDYFHQKWGWFARLSLKIGEYISCHVPHKTIVVSKSLAEYVKEKYNRNAFYIPNGADVKISKRTDKIKQWELKERKYILSLGRLIKHKGIHYLIEAFKQLEDTAKTPNNFKLVIVGDGFHTDDYVRYLHTIAYGRENIIFTGAQSGETVRQLFSHAYLFVQPSESEGMSLALLEAMGYGLAPLVSDIKENVEVVGEEGVTFASKSVSDLKSKLAYLLSRPDEVAKFGENANKRVREKYGWDSIARETLEVYEAAIMKNNEHVEAKIG
jgi:glycosyltransferase involved in cell wall biosynthesis